MMKYFHKISIHKQTNTIYYQFIFYTLLKACTNSLLVTEMNLMQTLNTIISVIENSEENMLNEINQKDKIFWITGFLSIQDEGNLVNLIKPILLRFIIFDDYK